MLLTKITLRDSTGIIEFYTTGVRAHKNTKHKSASGIATKRLCTSKCS